MKRLIFALALSVAAFSAQAEIVTEEVVYEVKGESFKGYLAYDNSITENRPAVLVFHEWWGQNEHARERARTLAEMGYTGFAVDMYGDGRVADNPEDATNYMNGLMSVPGQVRDRFFAAYQLVREHRTVDRNRVGALGYCMGGKIVLDMARTGAELRAAATFHAILNTDTPATAGSVKAPIKVFSGLEDPFVPHHDVVALEEEMRLAGAEFEFIEYQGVLHSFTNPGADALGEKYDMPLRYNAEADRDSWARTRIFLEQQFSK